MTRHGGIGKTGFKQGHSVGIVFGTKGDAHHVHDAEGECQESVTSEVVGGFQRVSKSNICIAICFTGCCDVDKDPRADIYIA